jgi:hypothetical protein
VDALHRCNRRKRPATTCKVSSFLSVSIDRSQINFAVMHGVVIRRYI